MNRELPISALPVELPLDAAVEAACAKDLAFIEDKLAAGHSVLVECDKELVLHLLVALRARLKRQQQAGQKPPKMTIVDGRGGADDPPGGQLPRMINQLGAAIRGASDRSIVVLPHLDVLTTTNTGLTLEAREAIPLLYENPDVCVLGFRDPSFELPKVLRGVFSARREIVGVPREALPRLITQREAKTLSSTSFDPYSLYTLCSGQNPIRLRRLLSDLATRAEAPFGSDNRRHIYKELRQQTATSVDDVELPQVDLDTDIGGYLDVKTKLKEELIELTLRKDTVNSAADVSAIEELLPRGVIFHGPPGTGKTHFARAVATALSATLIVVSGPELKSKWVGESEENLRRIFRRARQAAPSVIVFDEIDAFAHARGTYHGSGVEHSMVNQLLTEMDGFRRNETVFVIGTTNLLESVDPALLRPGRFEFLIEIPAPDDADRAAICRLYNERQGLALDDASIDHLVKRTAGDADTTHHLPYTGDHIAAAFRALKRLRLRTGQTTFSRDDLDKALLRKQRKPVVLSAAEERTIAVHEAGHAVLAMLVPGARPPEKIALSQDVDGALGYVLRAARARPYATTATELRAEICVGLGGMEAERLVFGDVSIGAWGDLQAATSLARAMVGGHGMDASLSPRVMLDDEHAPQQMSEQRRAVLDDAVDRLLSTERDRAQAVLSSSRALLDSLVAQLLRDRVIEAPALATLAPARSAID
ncbi:MAG TPA: AAA family ATPase [Myxococcota bacterium]